MKPTRRSFLKGFILGAAGLFVPDKTFFFLNNNPIARVLTPELAAAKMIENEWAKLSEKVRQALLYGTSNIHVRWDETLKTIECEYPCDLQLSSRVQSTQRGKP